jgi:sugar phosphate isomerase/epimerase
MISRKSFIEKTGTALAASLLLPFSDFYPDEINTGLALYTLRDEMAKDPDGTLATVARIGYNWVEAAGYSEGRFYNLKPSDFQKLVEKHGLKLISSHSMVNQANIDRAAGDAAEAGLAYLVMPSLPTLWRKSLDGYKEAVRFFNIAGEKCLKAGLRFAYHNHTSEFKKSRGQIPYDLLVAETDPALVTFEPDICWMIAANQSATDYFKKYPGRFELFHLKDMTSRKKDVTLGEGIIDFKPIFDSFDKAGMKYFFVEQDNCLTHNPFDSIKISRDYLLKNFSIL